MFEARKTPKRGGGRRTARLTAYESVLLFYHRLQERYGWTIEEVDKADMAFVLDQLLVIDKAENPPVYIEDVVF